MNVLKSLGVEQQAIAFAAGAASRPVLTRHEPSLAQFAIVVGLVAASSFEVARRFGSHAAPPLDALLSTLAFLGGLVVSTLHYRILSRQHPLHGIPGPFLARCSQTWLFSRVVRGQTRLDMRALHQKYGDVVRIGPNEVSIGAADDFLVVHGGKSWIKGASYLQTASGMSSQTETSLISLRNHDLHTNRRKLWDKAFATQALRDYNEVIRVRVDQLLEQVTKRAAKGEEINLHDFFGFFVWDVMTDLAYGGGGTMLKNAKDTDNSLASLCTTLHLAGVNKVLPWISPLVNLCPIASHTRAFRETATKLFKARLARGRSSSDKDVFFYLLGEESGDGTALTKNELAADSALVIAAGADTTRLVLSTLFMFLVRHPEKFKLLQSALDDALGPPGGVPAAEVLATIPLLDAYINEALRLNPPVPFANQREAPEGGATFGPYFIGGGCQVRFATYSLHRDARYFSDPEEFKPERWLPDADPSATLVKKAFQPFLAGPYHCVGKQFAMQEMRMLIATLVHKFNIEAAASFDSQLFERTIEDRGLVEIHTPLILRMTERK